MTSPAMLSTVAIVCLIIITACVVVSTVAGVVLRGMAEWNWLQSSMHRAMRDDVRARDEWTRQRPRVLRGGRGTKK